ncbi:MAG: nucleoside deaminase [Actinomycetales bacterium]|nr:nucleoside deaminase [Candidatus Lutibacillus vidarii]
MREVDAADRARLRQAIEVSRQAVDHGNHPFGAVLCDAAGELVLVAENVVNTSADVTAHAETALVRLASVRLRGTDLSAYTMYASCEPCAMCAGAIYWAGIGRVVFALSEHRLREITGAHPANPTLALPCRTVFAGGQRPTEVHGPLLDDEAAAAHHGFWSAPA